MALHRTAFLPPWVDTYIYAHVNSRQDALRRGRVRGVGEESGATALEEPARAVLVGE
eukprot:SAG11_NODE_298_length_11076_cov_4.253621_10_plen_57_part_00